MPSATKKLSLGIKQLRAARRFLPAEDHGMPAGKKEVSSEDKEMGSDNEAVLSGPVRHPHTLSIDGQVSTLLFSRDGRKYINDP
jgi:hypothetical protein